MKVTLKWFIQLKNNSSANKINKYIILYTFLTTDIGKNKSTVPAFYYNDLMIDPRFVYTVESRYLEYSISRTLDVSNKTIGHILINLHKMTTR